MSYIITREQLIDLLTTAAEVGLGDGSVQRAQLRGDITEIIERRMRKQIDALLAGNPVRQVIGPKDVPPVIVAPFPGDGDVEVKVFFSSLPDRRGRQVVQIDTEQHADFHIYVNDGAIAHVTALPDVIGYYNAEYSVNGSDDTAAQMIEATSAARARAIAEDYATTCGFTVLEVHAQDGHRASELSYGEAKMSLVIPPGAIVTSKRCTVCKWRSDDMGMLEEIYGGMCPNHGDTMVPAAFVRPRRRK